MLCKFNCNIYYMFIHKPKNNVTCKYMYCLIVYYSLKLLKKTHAYSSSIYNFMHINEFNFFDAYAFL